MKILDIPKEDRPRERFLKLGPEALSNAELFAILLRTGIISPSSQKKYYHPKASSLASVYWGR
jgi:DNA repair protein RadC